MNFIKDVRFDKNKITENGAEYIINNMHNQI